MLKELRIALIFSSIFVIIFFFLCYNNRIIIYKTITKPITDVCKKEYNSLFIYTSIFESFIADISISFYTSLLMSFPVILICLYWFVQKSLYSHEKKKLAFSLFLSFFFVVASVIIIYFFLLPHFIQFFMFGVNNAIPMLKISEYISTFFHLIFILALVFQFPIIFPLLAKFGLIKNDFLKKNRKIAIISIFIIAAIITPPDVFSQIVVASILIMLYEITNYLLSMQNTNKINKKKK